ncbi:unnamed protein product [Acanthoscelides obtectus]|uniref:Uncharacterized protein n=1 Tax=Acanthoscelides obtectus TaxID=200917 RepID=A0A9P0LJR1_ACAOB|nr:unnamed protein product [Acanthoscelides obtectus]CAK1626077.1 hypothetical protein AOBTE_LOCUS3587 [Acanthoscelides obtectus]
MVLNGSLECKYSLFFVIVIKTIIHLDSVVGEATMENVAPITRYIEVRVMSEIPVIEIPT